MVLVLDADVLIKFAGELVQKNVEKVFKGVSDYGNDKYKSVKVKTGYAYRSYYESAINKYSKVKTVLNRTTPRFLYDFYVSTSLGYGDEKKIDNVSVADLLEVSNQVIITGTAGSGKSTFMKHLFIDAVKEKKGIPLYIEMKDINDISTEKQMKISTGEYSIVDFIHDSITDLGFDLEKRHFEETLSAGNLLVFLDGFDEVSPEIKSKVSNSLINLSNKHLNNSFIVSSRPDDEFISWGNFTELNVLPLTKNRALELISDINYDEESKNNFMLSLEKDLFVEHEEFASNPLLLTIMLMTFTQNGAIPEKLHVFYDQAFETLFNTHDATKGGFKRPMHTKLSIVDFEDVFSSFSILTYLDNKISFDGKKIFNYLEKAKELSEIEFNKSSFLSDLEKSLCMLVKDGFKYTYAHRSFQEYFTALYISRETDFRQQRLLEQLLPRVKTDHIVDMLFEIKRERLELNYIIPVLEKLEKTTKFNQNDRYESYRIFIDEMYSKLNLVVTEEDGGVFKRVMPKPNRSDDRNLYWYTLNLALRKYRDEEPINISYHSKKFRDIQAARAEIFEKILGQSEANSKNISISSVLDKISEEDFHILFKNQCERLDKGMDILSEIKDSHNRHNKSVEKILFS